MSTGIQQKKTNVKHLGITLNPIYDMGTKNKSFITVSKQLELLGIKNNKFHLLLLNPLLKGVNPYDPNITPQQAMMVIQECKLNIFYYLREVLTIEESGSGTRVPFRMDRGTLAALYCFYNNINFYLIKPRQTGKTVGICGMLSWAFKFSGPNGDFLFSCYDEELSKKNLRSMRNMLQSLPSYMANMGTTTITNDNKTKRKTDNIKKYTEPGQNNSAMVAKVAHTVDSADRVGRGYTHIYQYFDECEFIDYIDTIVKVSGMSYNTASINAEKNGSGHCRIFSTTPGDLGNEKACQSALKIVNDSLVWDERWYDRPLDEFNSTIKAKTNFRVVYIEYSYKQLGYGEDWFTNACSKVGNDMSRIRREILLQRYSGNSKSPFTTEEIEELKENIQPPKWVKHLTPLYDLLIYEKPIPNRMYFLGLDPSDGTGGDNYAFTVIDPYTLKVTMEFKSPYMTIDGCCDLVEYVMDNYYNNLLIVIERNKNGGAVVEKFKSNPKLRRHVYASAKANEDTSRIMDELDENGFIKEQFIRNKYFGTTTTTSTRQVMMNIMLDVVHFAREYVTSQYLVEDLLNLEVRREKIQAVSGKHDDNVMSWLLVMYVYYYGEKLERWGFVKGQPPQDVVEDDKYHIARRLYSNPEVKRQFPSLYSFYKNEMALQKAIELYEQGKNDEEDETTTLHKIGGLNSININTPENIIPELDEVLYDKPVNNSNKMMAKFLSLNN